MISSTQNAVYLTCNSYLACGETRPHCSFLYLKHMDPKNDKKKNNNISFMVFIQLIDLSAGIWMNHARKSSWPELKCPSVMSLPYIHNSSSQADIFSLSQPKKKLHLSRSNKNTLLLTWNSSHHKYARALCPYAVGQPDRLRLGVMLASPCNQPDFTRTIDHIFQTFNATETEIKVLQRRP